MVNLLLPSPASRARLRAFWVACCSLVAAVAVPVGALVGRATATGVGAALTAVLVFGLLWPYAIQVPYRAWNYAARRFLALAVRYVTAVCFHTVVRAQARWRPPERFEAWPTGTAWRDRGTQPPGWYASLAHDPAVTVRSGWIARFRSWAKGTGGPTALALLPFLVVLRAAQPEPPERSAVPTNIYTLY